MNQTGSPNVIFALLIGIALVSGVVVYNNLTERIASAPDVSISHTLPQELPDVQSSSLRNIDLTTEDNLNWQQTIPEQSVAQINLPSTIGGTYEPSNTLTRRFGMDVFTQTIQAVAEEETPEQFNQRLSSVTGRYAAETTAQNFTGADIQTTPVRDISDIRSYMNTLADIFAEHSPKGTRGRSELFQSVIENKSEQASTELRDIAQRYQQMRNLYIATPVPHEFITAHVALINTLEALQNDLNLIASFATDPLAGQLAVQRYPNTQQSFTRALQNIGIEIIRHQEAFDFAEDSALLFVLTLPDIS